MLSLLPVLRVWICQSLNHKYDWDTNTFKTEKKINKKSESFYETPASYL